MIDKILEQRISLKFLAKLKKSPTESYKLLQDVYGESVLSKECAFEWHKQFSEGREDIQDDSRSDHQPSRKTRENVEKVRQLVHSNRRISTRIIANKLGISKETVRRILTVDLRMVKALPICLKSKGKASTGEVNGELEETAKNEVHFGSKFAEINQGKSEDSDCGEWDDIESVEGAAKHPVTRDEHTGTEVIIKQEVMDEDDCMMDEGPSSNENINNDQEEMRNPSWNYHYNQEHHLGLNTAEPQQQSSDSSDVGDWGYQERVETAAESAEQTATMEKNSVHEVMVKQEVMEDEEDDVMDENFNPTADISGEFGESEEPPWDEPPPFENIPVSAEMEEDFESNQVGYDEFEAMNSSDQNEVQSGYICHYCNQSFVTKRQLYGHMAWHSRKGGRYDFQDTPHGRSRSRAIAGYSTSISKVRSWLHEKQAEMKFTCLDCNQEFFGVGPFTSHKGIHRRQDKKFYCSVCNHSYPRAIDLIFHEWTNHTGDRPFPCDRCPSAFARQTSWTYHIIAHINNGAKFPNGRMRLNSSGKSLAPSSLDSPSNDESVTQRGSRSTPVEGRDFSQLEASPASTRSYPFKCLTCGKGISNEESWEYHLAVHPSGGETRQNLSPSNLERLRALLLTTLTCENKAEIACLECGLETVGIFALARHKSDQHLTKGGYCCTVCHKKVENVHKFIRHEMTHSKVKIYVCEMCGKEMADRMSFIHHIIVHFKDQQCEPLPVVTSSIQPVVNDAPKREEMKDKSFHHLVQRLLEPIKAFLKQELVPCLQCGQVFEGIQRLVSHKESHTNNASGSLRYACWVCSEVFESAKSLVEHEWIHTGMKPYKCDQCEQRFSSKIFWVGHVRGHFLEGRKSHPN